MFFKRSGNLINNPYPSRHLTYTEFSRIGLSLCSLDAGLLLLKSVQNYKTFQAGNTRQNAGEHDDIIMEALELKFET